MKKIEIKTILGEVCFSWESEKNTVKETVIELLKANKGKWIEKVNLSEMDLSGIDFSNSKFDNSKFFNSKFYNSQFYNSKFYNSKFYNSQFDNSKFYNSQFDNSQFYNSQFDNSQFYNSKFDNSKFYNSKFYNSQFYNSQFYNFIYNGIKVKTLGCFNGLYKYTVMAIVSEDGTEYVRLGCHTRLVSEWEKNFWNNPSEFPNDGSLQSEYRVMAYELCKKWLAINKASK